MRIIGFSHGDLYKIHDVNTVENLRVFLECESDAIEINCHHEREFHLLESLAPAVRQFKRVSLHSPGDVRYENNQTTRKLIQGLEDLYDKFQADLIVVHPDLVDDWSVFVGSKAKWAIENMDDRKEKYRSLAELKEFFSKNQEWKMVLDLSHCKANDDSMSLADNMILEFSDRIVEIHLSGHKELHEPLYKTRQFEIIDRCKKLSVPIIIESIFEPDEGMDGIKKEYNYIVEHLK